MRPVRARAGRWAESTRPAASDISCRHVRKGRLCGDQCGERSAASQKGGVEAGGQGLDSKAHAARLASADATLGVAQGYKTYFLQNSDGQMNETHSVAAGLDYVGVSPILAHLGQTGRVRFEAATDEEVVEALTLTMRQEGLIPALESSHAFVQAYKEAPTMSPDEVIIINQSGRGDKDIFTIADAFGDPEWEKFIQKKAKEYHAR